MTMVPYQSSWICLIFGYAQLILVLNAPFPDFCATNSSECLARRNMQQDVNDFSRILTRLNTSTHALLDSLITGLLNEDATIPPESQQQILFPDTYGHFSKQTLKIEKPPACAKSLSFCEEIDSYPHKHLDTVLRRTSIERSFFGTDEVAEKEFANRLGYSEQDIICASRETTIFPKAALNKNNKWKYVINQGENEKYIQGIRIEACLKPNSPCYMFGDAPVGYTLFCKQKYILRRLLSVSDTGQPVADSFRIPSACCCSVKKDLDFLTNFGRNASPSMKPTR